MPAHKNLNVFVRFLINELFDVHGSVGKDESVGVLKEGSETGIGSDQFVPISNVHVVAKITNIPARYKNTTPKLLRVVAPKCTRWYKLITENKATKNNTIA
jgi:hypothetical protein